MKTKSLNNTVKFLLSHNREQSTLYSSPTAQSERRFYRQEHPTEIAAFKCMDGRLNLPVFTEMPPGIIQPYRTMGGIFDLGDERLGRLVEDWHSYALHKPRRCLPLATYHFSKGSEDRGCAGHGHNTKNAVHSARRLVKQFKHIFGTATMYPVLVGIETDQEALVFHNDAGKVFQVSEHLEASRGELENILRKMFPDMVNQILCDLLQLVVGNQHHVKKDIVEKKREPIDLEHRERTICFGRGFDWLHIPNQALIIGPFGNNIEQSIIIAGNILLKNVKKGRVSKEDGFAVMTAGLYYEEGVNRHRIQVKTYSLYKQIKEVLEKNVPELMEEYDVQYLVGVTSHDTRKFTEIDVEYYEKLLESYSDLSEEEITAIAVKESELVD